jgi:hypothetical protein
MKLVPAIAIVALVLATCSPQAEIEVSIYEAFVYDVEIEPDDPDAHQLGLSVDSCNGDYEVEVDEAANVLTVRVLNHASNKGRNCSDRFTVHLDSPPHGKTVIDRTTGLAVPVLTVPAP